MNNPKISVVVAVYNAEKYFKQCMESILSQTFTEFELILVNDCSPDKSPQMCDEYAKLDGRIKVIHHKTNQGSIVTYRDGIDASVAEYITFVDSDDWIEQDTFERMYRKAVSENFDIVYCDVIRFINDGTLMPDKTYDTRGKEKKDMVIAMIEDKFTQYFPNKLLKRNLFNNVVWPDYQLREDTVVCVQLLLDAEKIGYEYSILYHYRQYSSSICSPKKNRYRAIRQEYENYKKLNSLLESRPDYHLYSQAMQQKLKNSKKIDRFRLGYYMKRFFMAFVPYGLLVLYRAHADTSAKKFLSFFVPYGIIAIYDRLATK